jgi:methylthioribose-1-phosphate isomerase
VLEVRGRGEAGQTTTVSIAGDSSRALNFAFDVTPWRLVTGYVTERGIAKSAEHLRELFPERAHGQD